MADDAQKHVKLDGTKKTNNSSMDSMSSQEEESVNYVIINSEDIHKVYDAKLENFDTFGLHNIVGGAMSTVNQTQTTPGNNSNLMPDIQQLMLQNQILMQAVLKNQAAYSEKQEFSSRKRASIPTCTVTREGEMAHVQTKKVKMDTSSAHASSSSKQKQEFINELDALIENDNAQKDMYSDISSSEESDSFDTDLEDEENEAKDKGAQGNDTETINVIQSMKDFVSSEEKSGPKINGELATVINEGLRKRANEDKLKELSKKYAKPANLTNLTVPKINTGIWKNMTATHKIRDVQLQRIQSLIAKAACPLAYLLDLFLEKSSKKESLTEDEINSATQLIRDGFQLTQVAFTDVSYRRRTFVKEDLQDKYKGLCNDDMPVTDNLFGDDIKEKMKDLDAEYSMGKKLKKSSYGKERSRRSYSERPNKGRGGHKYGHKPRHEGNTKGFFIQNRPQKEKRKEKRDISTSPAKQQLDTKEIYYTKQFGRKSCAEAGDGGGRFDSCGTTMDNSTLVSNHTSSHCSGVVHNSKKRKAKTVNSANESRDESSGKKPEIGSLQIIRQIMESAGLSKEASEILFSSWRPSTQSQYRTYIQRWCKFCSERQINMFTPTQLDVIEFLTVLFNSGVSYSSINTARSALPSFLSLGTDQPVGKMPLVKRFLKGVYNKRPNFPRYQQTWNVNVVLDFLKTLSPVNTLSLRSLTLKLAMLLALVTGQRVQTLHKLDLSCMHISDDCITIEIHEILKTSKPGNHLAPIKLSAFSEDSRICIVTVLKEYISRTCALRKSQKLFITFLKPYRHPAVSTISNWIKLVLKLSGVNTQIFKSHSTRSASTSAALKTGLCIEKILKAAGWTNDSTFRKFYNKPVTSTVDESFSAHVLQGLNK